MSVIEVHSEDFRVRLNRWAEGIHTLTRTLKKIAEMTNEDAIEAEVVPYLTGDLEQSFRFVVADSNYELQVAMTYSSVADDGYDYAYAQHENVYNHPIQGIDHYLDYVMIDIRDDDRWTLLDKDYMSIFER